jgi:hypothetical protein
MDHILKLREGTRMGADGILGARERIGAQFNQYITICEEGAAKYLPNAVYKARAGRLVGGAERISDDVAEFDSNRRQMKAMQTKMRLQNFAERVEALKGEDNPRSNTQSPVLGDKEAAGDGLGDESDFGSILGPVNGHAPILIPAAMRKLRRRARNGLLLAGKKFSVEEELKKLYEDFTPERIEKLNADILEQSRERGRLMRLQVLKRSLETHVLYQNALLLVARNELLQPSRYQIMKQLPSGEPLGPTMEGTSLADLDERTSLNSFAAEDSTAHLKASISECNEPASLMAKVLGGLPSPPPVSLSEVVREMRRRATGLKINSDLPKGGSSESHIMDHRVESAAGKLAGASALSCGGAMNRPQRMSQYLTLGADYADLVFNYINVML